MTTATATLRADELHNDIMAHVDPQHLDPLKVAALKRLRQYYPMHHIESVVCAMQTPTVVKFTVTAPLEIDPPMIKIALKR